MIIDCKTLSLEIYDEIASQIQSLGGKTKPVLGAVLVGNNSASQRYITQKQKWADYVGMGFELKQFDKMVSQKELLAFLDMWNRSENISGYIVQLPLPQHIDTTTILNTIAPNKDVDGFHPTNQGKILVGDESGFAPCTPAGVMAILKKYYGIGQSADSQASPLSLSLATGLGLGGEGVSTREFLLGKQVVVIGRSNIVGKPVTALCINAGATVVSCNSKTPDLKYYTSNADIVICAAGKPGLLKADMVSPEAVVIDVGFTVVEGKIYGDADFESLGVQGNPVTPVPGGVGRLTVSHLLKNTLQAWKNV